MNKLRIKEYENTYFVDFEEHKPIVISSAKDYRKGIEIDYCEGCKSIQTICMTENNKKYCSWCTERKLTLDGQMNKKVKSK